MRFRVRIDEISEQIRIGLVEYLRNKDHVLVHHVLPHGNPHFHFYVDLPLVNSVAAYKYQFKKLFPVTGSQFSIKECNENRIDEYKQYLFNRKHGNKPTLVSATCEVKEFQQLADNVAAEYASKQIELKASKKNGPTSWDMVMMLRSRIELYAEMNDHEYMSQIVQDAIDIHNECKKTFCDFSLTRIIQTAISTTKFKGYITTRVVNKVFSPE